MGNDFGRQVLGTVGASIRVSADGKPEAKAGGVTFDWDTAIEATEDVTLPDNIVVKTGEKYVPFGSIMCRILTSEIQVIDLSAGNDPTAGTFTITLDGYGETAAIAWNASAAAVKAAIEAVVDPIAGEGKIASVTKSGFQYTVTFDETLQNVPAMTVDSTALTGATSVTVTTSTPGSDKAGMFGLYDAGASDGRETLTRGDCYWVDETVKESDLKSARIPGYEGGLVWKARLKVGGAGQPSWDDFNAAFPRTRYVAD